KATSSIANTPWWAKSSKGWTWSTSSSAASRRRIRTRSSACRWLPTRNDEECWPMGQLGLAFVGVLVIIGLAAPARAQTPMSQCGVLRGRPCHPTFCGVFHRGPCMPYYEGPIGQDLRLTVVSTDDNAHGSLPQGDAAKSGSEPVGDGTPAKEDRGLDS